MTFFETISNQSMEIVFKFSPNYKRLSNGKAQLYYRVSDIKKDVPMGSIKSRIKRC